MMKDSLIPANVYVVGTTDVSIQAVDGPLIKSLQDCVSNSKNR